MADRRRQILGQIANETETIDRTLALWRQNFPGRLARMDSHSGLCTI
jgi:hypothetical protein